MAGGFTDFGGNTDERKWRELTLYARLNAIGRWGLLEKGPPVSF